MSLSDIREGQLKQVFDDLEEAFKATQIDFYVIGALARDIWYSRGDKKYRTTQDVDFALMISNKEDYEAVRNYLLVEKGFEETRENSFVMIAPSRVEINILPFGSTEIDESVRFEGIGLTSFKVNGFMEVYHSGTEEVLLETGHNFKIATLPAIVLLKFIANDDRPEIRFKDSRDIINIIHHFFDLEAEMIYDSHADLFTDKEDSLENISARVIGREMKKIIGENEQLYKRIKGILDKHIVLKEDSAVIRGMVNESGKNVDDVAAILAMFLKGLEG